VRFVKRGRTRPTAARRDVTEQRESMLGPVVSEERSALLSCESADVDKPVERNVETHAGSDPTQRLMTALGRFHRYVAKGQAGASQVFWSDDCMNQLAAAIEIALSQNWIHIVEVLTDVARILQSYENGGCADRCVPFLNDSYEILSVMVCDLIVNKVRSGTMEKWRERYRLAVAELMAEGLTLVQDDNEASVPLEPVGEETAEQEQEDTVVELPALGDAAPAFARPVASSQAASSDSLLPFLDAGQAAEAADKAGTRDEAAATEGARVEALTGAQDASAPPEVVGILDSLCDDLAFLEKLSGPDHAKQFEAIARKITVLEQYAVDRDRVLAAALCRNMMALCRVGSSRDNASDDRFLDTAYAFCEAYVEASKDPESAVAGNWQADCEGLLESWSKTVAEETPGPLPADGTPESLLETAQLAAARGDVSGAKALALQAVASIAREEAAKADARVQEAELRLRESGEAIDRARASVKRIEQEVVLAEARGAEGETELAEARAGIAEAASTVTAIEKRIAEIEEQIRALQAAQEAEETRALEAKGMLDRAREQEVRAETELRSYQDAEDAARLQLENARQNVKDLQRRRAECEAALARGRETLTRHRTSLADIERTVAQLNASEEQVAPQGGEFLF